ncbi:hypothetical protein MTY59_45670 [Mycobacterium senriense]|uniref:Uncharacterized protein n=1 Tax=Mycobacterium senriense TaxID=2775496 RepID=A0ABM7STI6_9MYCO|nr:hypothetical protein MTY59_45670 [Mycobacterium senriense]
MKCIDDAFQALASGQRRLQQLMRMRPGLQPVHRDGENLIRLRELAGASNFPLMQLGARQRGTGVLCEQLQQQKLMRCGLGTGADHKATVYDIPMA